MVLLTAVNPFLAGVMPADHRLIGIFVAGFFDQDPAMSSESVFNLVKLTIYAVCFHGFHLLKIF